MEVEAADCNRIQNINFVLDIGQGKVEELITYNQYWTILSKPKNIITLWDQEVYKFRAIMGHKGPLKATDPN